MASLNGSVPALQGDATPAPSFTEDDIHAFLCAIQEDEPPQQPAATTAAADAAATAAAVAASMGELSSSPEIQEDQKVQARVERKRSRERQRRSDVNKQFAELKQLLSRIEAEDAATSESPSSCSGGIAPPPLATTTAPSNRVDLIARTIHILDRLHSSNQSRKSRVASLEKQLEAMKKIAEDTAARLKNASLAQAGPPKQVMMMVPMMMTSDSLSNTGAPRMPVPGTFYQPQPFLPNGASLAGQVPTVASTLPSATRAQYTASTARPEAEAPSNAHNGKTISAASSHTNSTVSANPASTDSDISARAPQSIAAIAGQGGQDRKHAAVNQNATPNVSQIGQQQVAYHPNWNLMFPQPMMHMPAIPSQNSASAITPSQMQTFAPFVVQGASTHPASYVTQPQPITQTQSFHSVQSPSASHPQQTPLPHNSEQATTVTTGNESVTNKTGTAEDTIGSNLAHCA